jgi:hypothetical protein
MGKDLKGKEFLRRDWCSVGIMNQIFGNCWLDEHLVTSQEGLTSVELVRQFHNRTQRLSLLFLRGRACRGSEREREREGWGGLL